MTKTRKLRLIGQQMAFMSVLLLGCGPSDSAKQKLMNAAGSSAQIPSWEITKQSETGMPDITPETYLAAGQMHETQGRLTRAAAQYRMAIQLDPQHVEAHNRLGLVLCQMQQFQEADAQLAKAIKLDPNKPYLHNNLGFSYLIQTRWAEAEQSLRKAMELQPDFARAHVNLAMVLAQQERFDEAMRHFLAVVPMEDAWFNIGLMYQSKSRPAEAARAFKTALKLNAAMVAAQQCLDKLPPDVSRGAQPFENLTALASATKAEPAPEQPEQPLAVEPAYADIRTVESPDPTIGEPIEPEAEPLEMAETPQAMPSVPVQESSAVAELPHGESIAGAFESIPDVPPLQAEEGESSQPGPVHPEILAALMNTELFETPDDLPGVDLFAESNEAETEIIDSVAQAPVAVDHAGTAAPPIASATGRPSYITYDFIGGGGPKDLFVMSWIPEDPAEDQFEIVLSSRPPMPPAARNAVLIATQPSSDAPTPEELRTVIEALMELSHTPDTVMPKPYSVQATRPSAAAPQSQPAAGQTRVPEQLNMQIEMNAPESRADWRRPLWDDLEAFGPEDRPGSTDSDE